MIEGFRPGVMDRPWVQTAGHDINYLALTGALLVMGAETGAILRAACIDPGKL
ncbi:MAG: hypothetical protein WBB25_06635 [Sulfitobacter sp.]